MYRFCTFGGASLEGPDGPITGRAAQRRPLALLALLAASPKTTVSRDKVVFCLWPETRSGRARHYLSVSLHALRKALGSEAVLSVADDLRLNPERVSADVVEFRKALDAGEPERVVSLYAGPFLDGFHVSDAPTFERWLDERQAEYARGYRRALEELAEKAEARADWGEAVGWWKERAGEEPWSSRVAVRLMRALEAADDRPAALRHARAHARLVREEMGTEPDPEVLALADRIENGEPESSESLPAPGAPTPPPGEDAGDAPPVGRPAGGTVPERARGGRFARVARSPQGAAAVAAGLLLLATGLSVLATNGGDHPSEPAYDDRSVLVDLFANRTEDPELREVSRMATDWITQGLAYTGFVDVVTLGTPLLARPPELDPAEVPDRRARLERIAREHGTGTLVWGNVYRRGDSLYLQAHVTNAGDHRVIASLEPVAASADAPVPGLERLRDRVMTALATRTDPRLARWQDSASRPPTFAAYEEFVEGLGLVTNVYGHRHRDRRETLQEAAERFREAAALDSAFTMATLWEAMALGNARRLDEVDAILAEVDRRRERLAPLDRAFLDYQLGRAREWAGDGDPMEKLRAARRLVEIAPNSEYLKLAGSAALQAGRPAEAIRHYERADPESGWLRGWTPYWSRFADALHRVGDHERMLEVARQGRALYPEDQQILRREMRALAALGRTEELDAAIDELESLDDRFGATTLAYAAEELEAHGRDHLASRLWARAAEWERRELNRSDGGDPRGSRIALGYFLKNSGDLAGANEDVERLLAEHPDDFSVLRLAAHLRAEEGRGERARAFIRRIEELFGRRQVLMRAQVAAMLRQRERAMRLLGEIENPDLFALRHDGAFRSLRDHSPFQELLEGRE